MHIENFQSYVSLGCSKEEQSFPQPVFLSVRIQFDDPVGGEGTDQLSDAVDYVQICSVLNLTSTAKNYHLIEHMSRECLLALIPLLKKFSGTLSVTVKKVRVPVKQLQGGVHWTCQTRF